MQDTFKRMGPAFFCSKLHFFAAIGYDDEFGPHMIR